MTHTPIPHDDLAAALDMLGIDLAAAAHVSIDMRSRSVTIIGTGYPHETRRPIAPAAAEHDDTTDTDEDDRA